MHQMITNYMEIARKSVPMLPLERRTGVTEVEIGFDDQTAIEEAQRCLHCWVNTVFEGTEVDGSECVLCGGCVDVCPEQCLELVPLENFEFPEPVIAHLEQNETAYKVELRGVTPQELAAGNHRRGHGEGRDAASAAAWRMRRPVKEIPWKRSTSDRPKAQD
jgi:ferredoxin